MGQINRNSPCPCGSGKKYKKCCIGSSSQASIPPTVASGEPLAPSAEIGPWGKESRGRPQDLEMDRLLVQGYHHSQEQDIKAACDIWGRAWDKMLLSLKPTMTSCEEATPIYDGSYYLHDWLQDYCQDLRNLASKDTAAAASGTRFCREVVTQFSAEANLFRENFRAAWGEFHFLKGETEEGEKILLDLIQDWPRRSVGYAYLADMLSIPHYNRQGDKALDLPRAVAILEQALSLPVEDGPDYDMELRLADLKNA